MPDDPGPRPTTLVTADGCTLETVWSEAAAPRAVAVLTHPHPSYGGDLHNLVPATLAATLPERGVTCLRFNFRGAGRSTGEHGGGEAEIADVRTAIDAAADLGLPVLGIGYSFGADVLLATDDRRLCGVVAVAPPLAVLPLDRLAAPRGGAPTLLLSPDHDQFRPARDVPGVVADWPDTETASIAGADHFLAGAGGRVAITVAEFVDRVLGA